MPRPTLFARILGALALSLALASTTTAHADVSSWLFVGGGPSWLSQQERSYELEPTMQIDLGLGSPPSLPVIVGGVTRMTTYFGRGTDLALALRTTTQGFSTGDWGLALDAGGFARWWGAGSEGYLGSLHLGAPYGLTLSFNASLGRDSHRTFGGVVGIDLLRLTVYRLGGESWWGNPRPAYRPPQ